MLSFDAPGSYWSTLPPRRQLRAPPKSPLPQPAAPPPAAVASTVGATAKPRRRPAVLRRLKSAMKGRSGWWGTLPDVPNVDGTGMNGATTASSMHRILSVLKLQCAMDAPDACFIDFGCGDGRVLCAALEVCPSLSRAIGIDVNPQAANIAQVLVDRFAQTALAPVVVAAHAAAAANGAAPQAKRARLAHVAAMTPRSHLLAAQRQRAVPAVTPGVPSALSSRVAPGTTSASSSSSASATAPQAAAAQFLLPQVAVRHVDGMRLVNLAPATHLYTFCFGMPHEVLIKLMHLVSLDVHSGVRYACFVGVCGVLKDLIHNLRRWGPRDAVVYDSRKAGGAIKMAGSGESKHAVVVRMTTDVRAFFREFVAAGTYGLGGRFRFIMTDSVKHSL